MTASHTTAVLPRGRPRRRWLAAFVAAAALVSTVACGGDSSTGPQTPTNPVGFYDLAAVDRAAVPAEVYRGPYTDQGIRYNVTIQVTRGGIVLDETGAFLLAVTADVATDTRANSVTMSVVGAWEVHGGEIDLRNPNGTVTGSIKNGAIILPLDVVGNGTNKKYTFRLSQ
jgi:hypothetical protein